MTPIFKKVNGNTFKLSESSEQEEFDNEKAIAEVRQLILNFCDVKNIKYKEIDAHPGYYLTEVNSQMLEKIKDEIYSFLKKKYTEAGFKWKVEIDTLHNSGSEYDEIRISRTNSPQNVWCKVWFNKRKIPSFDYSPRDRDGFRAHPHPPRYTPTSLDNYYSGNNDR